MGLLLVGVSLALTLFVITVCLFAPRPTKKGFAGALFRALLGSTFPFAIGLSVVLNRTLAMEIVDFQYILVTLTSFAAFLSLVFVMGIALLSLIVAGCNIFDDTGEATYGSWLKKSAPAILKFSLGVGLYFTLAMPTYEKCVRSLGTWAYTNQVLLESEDRRLLALSEAEHRQQVWVGYNVYSHIGDEVVYVGYDGLLKKVRLIAPEYQVHRVIWSNDAKDYAHPQKDSVMIRGADLRRPIIEETIFRS